MIVLCWRPRPRTSGCSRRCWRRPGDRRLRSHHQVADADHHRDPRDRPGQRVLLVRAAAVGEVMRAPSRADAARLRRSLGSSGIVRSSLGGRLRRSAAGVGARSVGLGSFPELRDRRRRPRRPGGSPAAAARRREGAATGRPERRLADRTALRRLRFGSAALRSRRGAVSQPRSRRGSSSRGGGDDRGPRRVGSSARSSRHAGPRRGPRVAEASVLPGARFLGAATLSGKRSRRSLGRGARRAPGGARPAPGRGARPSPGGSILAGQRRLGSVRGADPRARRTRATRRPRARRRCPTRSRRWSRSGRAPIRPACRRSARRSARRSRTRRR